MSRFVSVFLFALCAVLILVLGLRAPTSDVPPRSNLHWSGLEIINPGSDRCSNCSLRVENGQIVALAAGQAGGDDRFAGRFVLPGLIDVHVHHPHAMLEGERRLFALLFLAHGVTSVRDVGRIGGNLNGLRVQIRRGRMPGPRIFHCGPMLDRTAQGWPWARIVDAPGQAEEILGRLIDEEEVDCIKLYNDLGLQTVDALIAAAANRALPVVAHVPDGLEPAHLPGVEIQHLLGTTYNWSSVSGREIAKAIAIARRLEQRHTPTLVVFDHQARQSAGYRAPWLPAYYEKWLWHPDRNPKLFRSIARDGIVRRERIHTMTQIVSRLHAAGVPILAGTDTLNPYVVPGQSLQEELVLLHRAGLSAEQAWASATQRAGDAIGVPNIGVLAVGTPADFLVFREDPTRNLAALDSLEWVVADGRVYRVEDLRAELERYAAHFRGPLYAPISDLAARVVVAFWNR